MTFENIDLETENVSSLRSCLLNEESPLSMRFRALFTLKSINNKESIRAIEEAFDEKASALLNHELAYVLGQMKNELAIPKLTEILSSPGHALMTRHEAAEALGAIQKTESLKILRFYMDPSNETEEVIRQTCELAIRKIETGEGEEPHGYHYSTYF
jgi:deoxyhypusine monooxygenase